jgi:GTP-binding protein
VRIEASFVRSAASAGDLPREHLAEIVLVGRSNVGKSSLINALVRRTLARTSVTPGKTRLANVYRIARGSAAPIHLVDLPGYGYARGLRQAQAKADPAFDEIAQAVFERNPAALLLVDSRHPGLESDRAAWEWVSGATADVAVLATKIDKLARGERIRAMRQLESVYGAVLPVSATTGEGMDELWNLIDRLAKPAHRNSSRPSRNPTARPLPTLRLRSRPAPSKAEGPKK